MGRVRWSYICDDTWNRANGCGPYGASDSGKDRCLLNFLLTFFSLSVHGFQRFLMISLELLILFMPVF